MIDTMGDLGEPSGFDHSLVFGLEFRIDSDGVRAFADRTGAMSGRLKALVHADEAAGIELEPGLVEPISVVSGTTAQ
jgi:hypothetical protein